MRNQRYFAIMHLLAAIKSGNRKVVKFAAKLILRLASERAAAVKTYIPSDTEIRIGVNI
jgi:hypothetical protein